MRIFDRIPKTTRASVIESAVGVGATLGISALCGVPNLGLQAIVPHPVWLVVLVIAARYGTRGLGVALPIAWGALAVMSGAGGPGACWTRWRCRWSWGRWRAPCWSAGSLRATSTANAGWRARPPSWNGA